MLYLLRLSGLLRLHAQTLQLGNLLHGLFHALGQLRLQHDVTLTWEKQYYSFEPSESPARIVIDVASKGVASKDGRLPLPYHLTNRIAYKTSTDNPRN